jgi:hypothetical protein
MIEKKVNAGKVVPYSSQLTPECLVAMNISSRILSKEEVELVQERVLFQFEGAITFEDAHMRLLDSAIEPPVVIHTVSH